MAEQIGLEAVFDLSSFNKGIGGYTKSLSGATKDTSRAAGSMGKAWNDLGKNVAGVAKTMAVGIVAAGAAAGAAIAGFAVSGIQKAADLQAQMSNIAAVFNTTAENVAPLKDLIMELGLDPNLTVSTMEAAEAIEMLGKNGLSMAEIMDGAARSTVLLANATGADFSVAADIATDAMAIFGIEAANMDAAVNGITAVTVASKFSIDDYRLAMAQAGGVAGAVGVSFNDFNTTIAAISPSFASGSDAGTSFKTMLQRLIPQSDKAADTMFDLGLMTIDYDKAAADLAARLGEDVIPTAQGVSDAWFKLESQQGTLTDSATENADAFVEWTRIYEQNQFFDAATGDMKDMNEIAVLLNGALAGLTEEQKLAAVTTLAGADASRAMLDLMDAGAVVYTDAAVAAKALGVSQAEVNKVIEGGVTQFEALQLTMGQTDAAQQAEERNRNFAAALKILGDTIESVQMAIGDLFLPMLEEMARSLNDLIKENAPAIIAFFQSFRDDLIALGNYLKVVVTDGNLMNGWLTKMSPTLAAVVVSVTALAGAIGTALGGALTFIQTHMDAFKGALTGIAAVLAAATITAGITAMAGALATLLTPMGLVILAAAGLGAVWNTNWLGMRDKTIAIIDEIKEAFTPLTTAIEEFGSGALTEIQDFVTGNETEFTNLKAIWGGAKESFANVSTGIQEAATGFVTYLKEQFPQLTPVFDGFASAVALVASQTGSQFTLLQDATSSLVSLVTSLIEGDWATAWQSAQDLAGAFVTYVEETFVNVKTTFEETFGAINPVITGALTEIQNFVVGNETEFTNLKTIWDGAKTTFGETFGTINPVITGALTEIQNFVTGNETEFTNLKTIWDGAKTSFDEAFSGISTWFTSNWPGIKATLEEWGVDFGKIEEAVGTLQQTWDTFSKNFQTAIDTVTTAWQGLVDLFGPSIDRLVESVGTFIEDIQGLGTEFSELQTATDNSLGKIQDAFSELWDIVGPIVDDIAVGLGKVGVAIGAALGFVAILAINLFASTFEHMGEIVKTVIDQVTVIIETVGTVIDELVTGVKAVIDGDWQTAWDSLKNIVTSVVDLLTTSITNLQTLIETLGTTVYDAIVNTLDDAGILTEVQEFVRVISDTLTGFIDWEFIGRNMMAFVRNGISFMKKQILDKANEIVTSVGDAWTTVVDWLQTGKDIIQLVIDGLAAMLGNLTTKMGELAQEAYDALFETDWLQAGKDIIDGILDGLKANGSAIAEYIKGLAQDAWDAISGVFIFGSPSKLMFQAGVWIIEGWIAGMRSMENKLYSAIQHISDGVARIAGRAGANAIAAYTSALSSFSSVGGSLLDRIGSGGPAWVSQLIGDEQRTLEFLQEQADLIEAIRASGADPADVLRGVTLGPSADPVRLAQIVGETMRRLRWGLEQSIRNAASGLDRALENMRDKRQSIADIEEKFVDKHITTLDRYAEQLAGIDQQIANMESLAIRSGDRFLLTTIQGLDRQRAAILRDVERHLAMQKRFEDLMATMPMSENQRGQEAIDRWRKSFIDPWVSAFNQTTGITRAGFLKDIERQMVQLRIFANSLPRIADVESFVGRALEGFGSEAQRRAETLLGMLYDPGNVRSLNQNVQALYDFANSLTHLRNELTRRAGRRLNTENIIQQATASRDQMEFFRHQIGILDQRIAETSERALESGSAVHLQTLAQLDEMLFAQQSQMSVFLRQTRQLEDMVRRVKNLSGPGQASAQRFLQEVIQPIVDAFSQPMGQQARDSLIASAQDRINQLNRFVDQMRQVERLQARVAGNELFASLADEFAMLQDILMPETQRGSLINQLNSYITQMMRLHEIQRDISAGRGINPIVERFASERLDTIARQLENINLTEAERNRLIEQYRIEQEKILALQQKQQQLDFINQQLALINQLRSLDDEEGWSVDVESILSGIGLGMNASIDDLMRLTARVLDELVRFANHELGIASPSKVFAKVGMNLMAGLESGIMAGMRQPMNALRSAAGNLIPYSLAQRALNINMGGVTINDGMDAVMFEARIRQIVRSEFAA